MFLFKITMRPKLQIWCSTLCPFNWLGSCESLGLTQNTNWHWVSKKSFENCVQGSSELACYSVRIEWVFGMSSSSCSYSLTVASSQTIWMHLTVPSWCVDGAHIGLLCGDNGAFVLEVVRNSLNHSKWASEELNDYSELKEYIECTPTYILSKTCTDQMMSYHVILCHWSRNMKIWRTTNSDITPFSKLKLRGVKKNF